MTSAPTAGGPLLAHARPTLFAGDPHGQLDQVLKAVSMTNASSVVLLGDIEPKRPLEDEMRPLDELGVTWHFIAGNHDSDSEDVARRVWNAQTAPHNIHARVVALPNGSRTRYVRPP